MNNESTNPHDNNLESQESSEQSGTQEQDQLAMCQFELQIWKDKYVHVLADFENFKKRFARERLQLFEDTKIQVLKGLLPIVDDIDRALEDRKNHTTAADNAAWLDGFLMIQKSLHKLLQDQGLQEIGIQKEFDPELYEAVMTVDAEGQQEGTIATILQKGYKVGNRVVRPAKVSIAR